MMKTGKIAVLAATIALLLAPPRAPRRTISPA